MNKESVDFNPLFELYSPYEKARYFCNLLIGELGASHKFLTEEETRNFTWYYGNLDKKNNSRKHFYSHRHAQRIQHLVSVAGKGRKILDAGSAFGSESILCGILGAEVTGVDLIEPWVNIARKRLKYYEGMIGRRIPAEFIAQSVLDIHDSFDIIWALESISHIDPAEEFISFAHDQLNKGGKLIISDPNKLNPLIYINARRSARRAGGLHQLWKDPRTGNMVPLAQERVFTIFTIKKLLLSNGFRIETLSHSGLLPYLPSLDVGQKNMVFYLEKIMNPFWPSWLSGIYTVVAKKV